MISSAGGSAAVEAARRELVGLAGSLLDLQADTGQRASQEALDEAIERLAGRLLHVSDVLGAATSRRRDVR